MSHALDVSVSVVPKRLKVEGTNLWAHTLEWLNEKGKPDECLQFCLYLVLDLH